MTHLIDADEAIKRLGDAHFKNYGNAIMVIRETPTVNAQPIRHGKWYVWYDTEDGRMLRCSECKMVFWVGSGREGNYCPNCGAKMDEQEKKNEE